MALSFVLDEHIRGPLWQAVLRNNLRGALQLDVVRVGDTPDLPLHIGDQEILLWAEHESRILVTQDRHTMAGHMHQHLAQGRRSPGILTIRPNQRMKAIVESLVLIACAGEAADFADAITSIP